MRKVTFRQIAVFMMIYLGLVVTSIWLAAGFANILPLGLYRPLATTAFALTLFFTFSIFAYRLFIGFYPIPQGIIPVGSKYEFRYHVHLLFYLLIFHVVIRSQILPVPLMRLLYMGLGAKFGKNSFSSGIITDGMFVEIGDNTLIGHAAGIFPHAIENERLSHDYIRIGSNVTIGAHAIVFSGVTIEDEAIVSAGAVVPKGTHVKRGEIWGGVPSKLIGRRNLPIAKKTTDVKNWQAKASSQ